MWMISYAKLIWVQTVCRRATETFQKTTKADDFCGDWRIKEGLDGGGGGADIHYSLKI